MEAIFERNVQFARDCQGARVVSKAEDIITMENDKEKGAKGKRKRRKQTVGWNLFLEFPSFLSLVGKFFVIPFFFNVYKIIDFTIKTRFVSRILSNSRECFHLHDARKDIRPISSNLLSRKFRVARFRLAFALYFILSQLFRSKSKSTQRNETKRKTREISIGKS